MFHRFLPTKAAIMVKRVYASPRRRTLKDLVCFHREPVRECLPNVIPGGNPERLLGRGLPPEACGLKEQNKGLFSNKLKPVVAFAVAYRFFFGRAAQSVGNSEARLLS